MEIKYFGGNCLRITTKNTSVVIDDNLSELGAKPATKSNDIVLCTDQEKQPGPKDARMVIDRPGEYEVAQVSVQGVPARSHMDEEGIQKATMFKLTVDGVRLVALGHIYPELDEDQLEEIGSTDVLFVPVGGNGYTLDPVGALKMIKKIDPKIVVPTHYDDKSLSYPVPQQSLEDALHQIGIEVSQTVSSLKLKHSDVPEGLQLVVIEKS